MINPLNTIKPHLLSIALLAVSTVTYAEEYVVDTTGMHASITFKIQHLGYSWLHGRFNKFSGNFNYDKSDPKKTSVAIEIDTSSIDSNHAERDKHIRSKDFLSSDAYPKAKFVSTKYLPKENGHATLFGDFTLRGITKPMQIDIHEVGHGEDPWGGYRRGFEGTTKFSLADYGIVYNLGPNSKEIQLDLSIEGIRK